MNTKQWLSRARRIDAEINTLLVTYAETKDRLLKITQTVSGDIVQSEKDPHRYDKLAELSELIDRKVDELVSVKTEVAGVLCNLPKRDQKEVLILRYVGGKSWDEIAQTMNFSPRHVQRLHGRAIIELSEVLNGRTET